MTTPRFHDGQMFKLDGIQFRITRGGKAPKAECGGAREHHPDGDLVIQWFTSRGWVDITCRPLFLLVDFIAWNEDYLYPPPRFRGGNELLDYLKTARVDGHARATANLKAARERATQGSEPPSGQGRML